MQGDSTLCGLLGCVSVESSSSELLENWGQDSDLTLTLCVLATVPLPCLVTRTKVDLWLKKYY